MDVHPALRRRRRAHGLLAVAVLAVAVAFAGCGGDDGDTSTAPAGSDTTVETEAVETAVEETTEDDSTEEPTGGSDAGAAPAPGEGALVLDDGRSFAIAVTRCEFQPNGTFTVEGTSDSGASFEATQFYLGDEWSQSQVSIEFPNDDQVFVIVSKATPDGEPMTVDGKSVSWRQTFSELDESANDIVYRGEGTLRVTCT